MAAPQDVQLNMDGLVMMEHQANVIPVGMVLLKVPNSVMIKI